MASGQKKVVIRRFAGPLAWGYLPQTSLVRDDQVPLMAVDGRITPISLNEIKTIAYVHDFNLDDLVDPERIGQQELPRPAARRRPMVEAHLSGRRFDRGPNVSRSPSAGRTYRRPGPVFDTSGRPQQHPTPVCAADIFALLGGAWVRHRTVQTCSEGRHRQPPAQPFRGARRVESPA